MHDELVIETYREEEDQVRQILTEKMINAAKLAVMLEVDLHTGENWKDWHGRMGRNFSTGCLRRWTPGPRRRWPGDWRGSGGGGGV